MKFIHMDFCPSLFNTFFNFFFNIFIIFPTEPPKSSAYFDDIYKLLVSLVDGDESLIRTNHIAPYGYRVSKSDFIFSPSINIFHRVFTLV